MTTLHEIAHPVIDIDLRYASADNICGQPIYAHAVALLHADAHAALLRAAERAQADAMRLIVYDAFRPLAAQRQLWAACPDPAFVADPAQGSTHNRGIAVDLTLADARGHALDMGTGFDDMQPRSHHGNTDISAAAQRNRRALLELMAQAGWEHHPFEWWHYNLPTPDRYPLLDDADSSALLMTA
ncbi:D-alanyl-D-alanine dipeptidase [Acidihalobacter ferrooxydans]|uniref:D-alanyl-D-alanine dipeptidase n=1 Tax=Acidihalobacter ferrooxydans TaxID=1765967 RepID=A0A1P8UJY3_9GAMM|nr:D-alanyl-D-alanine dipeptidase [Acidihalobacter ferrooxydans]APZ44147.1 D-alanyl-D-alanine dipeptidase [Acidihalobacter ferrooxydans]